MVGLWADEGLWEITNLRAPMGKFLSRMKLSISTMSSSDDLLERMVIGQRKLGEVNCVRDERWGRYWKRNQYEGEDKQQGKRKDETPGSGASNSNPCRTGFGESKERMRHGNAVEPGKAIESKQNTPRVMERTGVLSNYFRVSLTRLDLYKMRLLLTSHSFCSCFEWSPSISNN